MSSTVLKVAAQVAVEAIVDGPDGYGLDTMEAVEVAAVEAGVAPFYLALLDQAIKARREVEGA